MIEQAGTDLQRWNSSVESVCGHFDTRFDYNNALFIGEIEQRNLGGTQVAHIRSNANSITRRKGGSDRADDRFCFLILQQKGAMEFRLESENLELLEGDIVLVDSAQSIEMLPKGLFAHTSIHLPREKLGSQFRFGKLSTAGMCGQLLRTLMRQVAFGDLDQWASDEEGAALEDALIALLQPVTRYDSRIHTSSSLRLQAERLIKDQLSSTGLTPAAIAEQMRISPRHLYRLFEADNESVCRYIQRLRIERAASALLDPALANRSITDIAFEWGYIDAAHFSRVFKRHFERSPREYRKR